MGIVENHLQVYLPSDCTQNQFDALIDFGFNLGCEALETMLGHGWDQVPTQILRWDKAGGQVVPGLAARRQRELILFQTATVEHRRKRQQRSGRAGWALQRVVSNFGAILAELGEIQREVAHISSMTTPWTQRINFRLMTYSRVL